MGNSHLPHFMPSKFDLSMRDRSSDKGTDFVAGDSRVETQVRRDWANDSNIIIFISAVLADIPPEPVLQ